MAIFLDETMKKRKNEKVFVQEIIALRFDWRCEQLKGEKNADDITVENEDGKNHLL